MLNAILQLERPLFILDIEATSLDVQTARIVEIAFQRWESSGLTKEWSSRINPGISISPTSTAIHHITDADVIGKPTFIQLAANLAKGFTDCSFGGQNCRYDLRVIKAEMNRAGQSWDYSDAHVVDSSQLERLAVPRNLSALHEKYTGHPHDGAHGALSDVRATATVIAKQLETYPNLPRDLDELHALQWPGWIDTEGKFRFVNGVPCFSRWGKYSEQPMRKADSSYYDFILRSDFSPEIKRIAEKAKLGQFPEAK